MRRQGLCCSRRCRGGRSTISRWDGCFDWTLYRVTFYGRRPSCRLFVCCEMTNSPKPCRPNVALAVKIHYIMQQHRPPTFSSSYLPWRIYGGSKITVTRKRYSFIARRGMSFCERSSDLLGAAIFDFFSFISLWALPRG